LLYLSIVIIALTLIAALSIVIYTLKNGIPPMPTTRYLCNQTEKIVRKYQVAGGTAVEAGSGWGTLALYLGHRHPQLQFIGLENSPLPFLIARLLRLVLRRDNCRFLRTDMYRYDYRETNIVLCYLFAGAMRRFAPLFREQLPDGALVISLFFAIPGWTPVETYQCSDLYRTKIYVYQITDRNETRESQNTKIKSPK
jgi:hypothetical protein